MTLVFLRSHRLSSFAKAFSSGSSTHPPLDFPKLFPFKTVVSKVILQPATEHPWRLITCTNSWAEPQTYCTSNLWVELSPTGILEVCSCLRTSVLEGSYGRQKEKGSPVGKPKCPVRSASILCGKYIQTCG